MTRDEIYARRLGLLNLLHDALLGPQTIDPQAVAACAQVINDVLNSVEADNYNAQWQRDEARRASSTPVPPAPRPS